MEHNRNTIVIGAAIIFVLFILLFVDASKTTIGSTSYWIGLGIGSGLGILTCLYLIRSWDPVNLQLKKANAQTANPKWLPIVVIGGIIAAKLVPILLDPAIETLLDNCLFAWFIITLAYIALQVWRYRQRH